MSASRRRGQERLAPEYPHEGEAERRAEPHDRDEAPHVRAYPADEEAGSRPSAPEGSPEAGHREASLPQDAGAYRSPSPTEGAFTPLFSEEEASRMQSRWLDIQASFVDEPRQAVQQADRLVDETVHRLSEMFTGERHQLERQWAQGSDVSTEDLRLLLQRYRSFFDRLLSL